MFAMKGQVKTSQFMPYICFNFFYTLRATFIDHKKMVNSAHYNQSKSDFKKGMPRKTHSACQEQYQPQPTK